MKKRDLFGAFLIASLACTACSDNDNDSALNQNTENEQQVEGGYKLLGNFKLQTEVGKSINDKAQSRTLGDIDEAGRPNSEYHLNKIGLLCLRPTKQPTKDDINKKIDYEWERKPAYVEHNVVDGSYQVYYKCDINNKAPLMDRSDLGTVTLTSAPGSEEGEITFGLSVFKKSQLKEGAHIQLNEFAYDTHDQADYDHPNMGNVLRYVSYNPKTVGGGPEKAETLFIDENAETTKLTGQVVTLPELANKDYYKFLQGKSKRETQLVVETQDKYFSGTEILFAHADDQLYLLTLTNKEGSNGGYYVVRKYPAASGEQHAANPEVIELNRLTSCVNASFMFVDHRVDETVDAHYYSENSSEQSISNFKRMYGVDLSTLACPYATIDGVNKKFFINEVTEGDKSTDLSRLVLWSQGHDETGLGAEAQMGHCINGEQYSMLPKQSNELSYTFNADVKKTIKGFGMRGNSYSVVFPGTESDTKDGNILFYTEVEGMKIQIKATLNLGVTFSPNVTRDIMVLVDAKDFADYINGIRPKAATRAAEDYFVYEVPSENVVLK